MPRPGPRPRPHAVRPLRRARHERADAGPRRLRAQPPDAAHPRGPGAALPGLPGAQPHLGGARGDHQAPRPTRTPPPRRSTRPARRPTLEAQLVDYVDEIAYNNHDVDDGLASGMFTRRADPRGRALPRGARRRAAPRASATSGWPGTTWCAGSSTAACSDLIETSQANLAAARVESVADVRRAGRRLVGYWPETGGAGARAQGLPAATTCTVTTAWCGWATRRGASCATCSSPTWTSRGSCPPHFQDADRARRRPPRRVRLHRGHDRPLRGGRAPEALRPDRAGLRPAGIA